MTFFDRAGIRHLFGFNSLIRGFFWYPYALEFAETKPRDRVLDSGCGFGSIFLGAYWYKNLELIAVDNGQHMCRNAHRMKQVLDVLPSNNTRYVIQADSQQLPLPDASIDTVIDAHNVGYYESDARSFVQEYHRVLRPGGSLIIVPHEYDPIRAAVKEVFGSYTLRGNFITFMGNAPLRAVKR